MSDLSTQALYAEAILGKDAEDFLRGDVGRYLLARAEEEENAAMEALAKVWPWRVFRIMALQSRLWRARSVKGWLAEIITAGHQALHQLEEQHEE